VVSWLTWCANRRWPAPQLPGDAERLTEHSDTTRALPRASIERLLSRRDIPLREKTLWRMLYETAARASEILALNVEDLDLEQRRAPVWSKGGDVEFVYWDSVRRALSSCLGQEWRAVTRLDLRVASDCVSRLASDGCI